MQCSSLTRKMRSSVQNVSADPSIAMYHHFNFALRCTTNSTLHHHCHPLQNHVLRVPSGSAAYARAMLFANKSMATRDVLEQQVS